ncbi:TetR family transcriptional regulator [Ktedonobacter sp. SOSP1-85]|uniref:TetR/AcrR family transcriptional regulator n=1 Tax=Ktedonobacter sp. SOSP1-85 TaxID=2778367 RepID=UPI001916380C|nr:TetR/AcrR family transcriptional regulator [Ktedonobacter sp. SOSP1-85]GHO79773.1 TetR family transcriptional regulator [Ktedonobacter sp. SOSP1-85]
MVRTINEAAHEARRNAILDAAQRAIETRGYEQMAIADLVGELHISSGAFYHYFDSKPALLEALIERIGNQIEQLVLPIVHDPTAGALTKLQRFFTALDHWKHAHRHLVFASLCVWYGDENVVVRHKLYIARVKRFTPWLEEMIRQGIEEGVLTTPYPDQAARMVISLFEDLGYATAEILCAQDHSPDDLPRLARIIEACADGLERLLGAPAGSIPQAERSDLLEWLVPPTQSREDE